MNDVSCRLWERETEKEQKRLLQAGICEAAEAGEVFAMPTREELKKRVREALRARRDEAEDLAEAIFDEPELGFREVKTARRVKDAFSGLGLSVTEGWGLTGVKARMKGGRSRRTVALLGELDAIVCRDHAFADPVTGAVHCCGHNVQVASLFAVAAALKDSGVMGALSGDVVLFAVPAEEYIEIGYREKLRREGKISYLGGKQQIVAEGGFDDIDMAFQMHVDSTRSPNGTFMCGASSNGFIGKLVEYQGRAAHAAGAPDRGINALNAAMMGVMGVNAIRETFREADCVRFHPIITSGGDLVNAIPERVTMESYVRAASVEALGYYNRKINRALRAGADAVGASIRIEDLPGYLPLKPDPAFREIVRQNALEVFGDRNVCVGGHAPGSTDMGDLSLLKPVVHSWAGCATGALHGADYCLANPEVAYGKAPEVLAMTIVDLLSDGARRAEEICRSFKPFFPKKSAYLDYLDSVNRPQESF